MNFTQHYGVFPAWMRLISFAVIIVFIVWLYAMLSGNVSPEIRYSAFGIESGGLATWKGIAVGTLLLMQTVSAFLILNEHEYAIGFGRLAAAAGIAACMATMVFFPVINGTPIKFQAEIILLIMIYHKLTRMASEIADA